MAKARPLRLDALAEKAIASEQDAAASAFTYVSLAGLATATPAPVDYAVDGLIPRGYVTLLGGHGGMGKSMLAAVWAAHLVNGREWAGRHTAKLPVLFVSLEDRGDLVRARLRWIADAYGLRHADIEAGVTVLDGSSGNAALFAEADGNGYRVGTEMPAMQEVRQAVAESGAGLVVIDNASDAFLANENERRQVRSFIRVLATIAAQNNAAVLLLAHIDKSAARNGSVGNSYSGSTAWHNSVRSRLALIDENGGPVLHHEKINLGCTQDPIRLAFNQRGVLMPVTREAIAKTEIDDDGKVLAAIAAVIASGSPVSTSTTGPCTTYHAIEHHLGIEFVGAAGKRRVKSSVERLSAANRIVRTMARSAHRKDREQWELAQNAPFEGGR